MRGLLVVIPLICILFQVNGLTLDWDILASQQINTLCCNTYAPTNQIFFCKGNAQTKKYNNFVVFGTSGVPEAFTPIVGLGHLEMKPASVKLAPNSGFPFPGWVLGDIFVPNVNGTIVRIRDATDVDMKWVKFDGETQMTNEIVFDATGTVYGGDLIVTFTNSIYRVAPDGTATLILKDNNKLKNYEGILVVPNNVTRYGKLAGSILLPQTTDTSVVAGYSGPSVSGAGKTVAVIAQDKSVTYLDTPCHVDTLYMVDLYDQFYSLDASGGNVFFSSWDSLKKAGFYGEILAQCEGNGASPTGFYRLYWDATGNKAAWEAIALAKGAPAYPGRWEHFCTSRGSAVNQLPGGFSFCWYTSFDTTNNYNAYQISSSIAQSWDYTSPASVAYPSTALPAAVDKAIVISIVQDSLNQFYLQIVGQNPASTGGSINLQLTYKADGYTDTNNLVRIRDSAADTYVWDGANGQFTWASFTSGNRGLVLGPIQHVIAMVKFTFTFDFTDLTGFNNVIITHKTGQETHAISGNKMKFSITRTSCTCGDNVVDPIEQCDLGASNGLNGSCCTSDCQLRATSYICNPANKTNLCDLPAYCDGNTATCPPKPANQLCNCTFPFYGFNCTSVRCDLLTNCSSCNKYPQCGFCCDTMTCVAADACTSPYPRACPACPATCNAGVCSCGACVCPAGFAGTYCNLTADCTGNIVQPGETPKVIDQCGICGGNGTSCIGCDGLLYGKQYDICGVCGGNGSSCFDPCKDYTTCADCAELPDQCGWCPDDNTCYFKSTASTSCQFQSDCGAIAKEVIIGASIGAGVIAGIAVGAAALVGLGVFGGKKGYDAWMKNKNNLDGAQSNPMYNDSGRSGQNPMYEMK